MQEYSRELRRNGKRTGFVPTMGFLHEGHLSLIDKAAENSDAVIVSIFVNPTQFAPNEDLDAYPRDFEQDCRLCELRGVDVVFAPSDSEMYPLKQTTWVTEESLTGTLCGKSRPMHFRGVTTVVSKLFNAVLPDIAVFGEKDYQQACIIKKMTKDLNFPVAIITSPIVREPDGLAMSSRNKYLSTEERKNALSINRALKTAEKAIRTGQTNSAKAAENIRKEVTEHGGIIDYIEIADAETLEPLREIRNNTLIAVAAIFGNTRLIDNTVLTNIPG